MMKRVLKNNIRKYHVPHDKIGKSFPREDNLFGDVQNHLSQQINIQKMVITINNPIYVSKESTEYSSPYSVDIHYGHKKYVHSMDGDKCEDIVRKSITWIIANKEA
jgi:hypothetical protein